MNSPHPPTGASRRRFAAVLLDRDGVINEERGHVLSKEDLRILPGVVETIAALNRDGIKIAVLTNQSSVARGLITEEQLAEIHAHMDALLAAGGAHIDFLAYSPWLDKPGLPGGVEKFLRDHPDRKPNPGMIHKACSRFSLSADEVCFLGDSSRDLECAARAGVGFFGIRSAKAPEFPDDIMLHDSLAAAIDQLYKSGFLALSSEGTSRNAVR